MLNFRSGALKKLAAARREIRDRELTDAEVIVAGWEAKLNITCADSELVQSSSIFELRNALRDGRLTSQRLLTVLARRTL